MSEFTLLNHLCSDAPQRPSIGEMNFRSRPAIQQPEPLPALSGREFGFAPRMRFARQSGLALFLVLFPPSDHGTGVTPTLRATSRTPCPLRSNAAP